MITPGFQHLRRTAAGVAIAIAAGGGTARAADAASSWDGNERAAVRLIAGASGAETFMRAGIEIRLKHGWHTYWRYPGDAGVPPRFEFSPSQNVENVRVLWPAPRRIIEEGMSVIGYTGDVILPLAIVPRERAKPAMLAVKIDYAVCERLCVPMQGTAELVLDASPSVYDDALMAAMRRVPKKRAVGEDASLAVKSIAREAGAAGRVIIDVAGPTTADVFAEGPAPDWALPVPIALAPAAPGLQRFAFPLDGAPPGAQYEGAVLTLTAVAGDDAIETTAKLP